MVAQTSIVDVTIVPFHSGPLELVSPLCSQSLPLLSGEESGKDVLISSPQSQWSNSLDLDLRFQSAHCLR